MRLPYTENAKAALITAEKVAEAELSEPNIFCTVWLPPNAAPQAEYYVNTEWIRPISTAST